MHGISHHRLLAYKGRQVIFMTDFEMLSIVLMIVALLLTAYGLGKK